jgi:hypothetical protein
MHAAEIIVRKEQSASGFQIFQFLRESVRQARKSAHCHPHGEVLPLDVRSDVLGIAATLTANGRSRIILIPIVRKL